ncbi:hypothetical protein Taro_021854 [Colocasia esculenta]|uniref:Uncharacterized protein n=1 Tax=Colocasia esculenta TaxID=4460 RepID=A0A843UZX8_COLES|nr:hypothetical protein [Colocasia esculenta]
MLQQWPADSKSTHPSQHSHLHRKHVYELKEKIVGATSKDIDGIHFKEFPGWFKHHIFEVMDTNRVTRRKAKEIAIREQQHQINFMSDSNSALQMSQPQLKYKLEDCHENYVVASLSKKWKDYKERLKKEYFNPDGDNPCPQQFIRISEINKGNRAKQQMVSTMRPKSIAIRQQEYAECPEAKKDKYLNHKKEFHKNKNKVMVATWSDDDQSSDSNKESSSSEGNEICFMAGSSEEQVYTNLSQWCRHSPPVCRH